MSHFDDLDGDALTISFARALGYQIHENSYLNGQKHHGIWLSSAEHPNQWIALSKTSPEHLLSRHSAMRLMEDHNVNLMQEGGAWKASSEDMSTTAYSPEKALMRCIAGKAAGVTKLARDNAQCTIELTVRVTYDLNGEQPYVLKENLEHMVFRAAGEGIFTGGSEAEVDDYSVSAQITNVTPLTAKQEDSEPVIAAALTTDDHVFEATFDALAYFEQASIENLRALVDCGFGGDYPADEVAEFFQGKNAEVDAVFDYVARISDLPSKKDVSGFECYIDENHAVDWLKKNRPAALSSLPEDDWRIHLCKGDQVYWKDPDGDISSGYYRIAGINDDNEVVSQEDTLLILVNDEGSVSEVFASEILQSKPSKRMRP